MSATADAAVPETSASGPLPIIDGRRELSCLTLAAMCDGRKITTIEGLAEGENLHPMQTAFIELLENLMTMDLLKREHPPLHRWR